MKLPTLRIGKNNIQLPTAKMTTEEKLLKKILREKRKWKESASKGLEEPNFNTISDALDDYYFISKLKIYCAYLSYINIKNADNLSYKSSDLRFLSTILTTTEESILEQPAFKIYNAIRILFENVKKMDDATDQLYLEIHQMIKKYYRLFDRAEKLDLYSLLSNFCIRKINMGVTTYQAQFFIVNNEMLNIKYGQPKSKDIPLSLRLYKNMVSIAILLKDDALFDTLETKGLPKGNSKNYEDGLDWATHFVEIYQYKLEKKGRIVYSAYCAGLLFFMKKDYLSAYKKLKSLSHVQFPFINLDLKTLQLRVLYEINKIQPEILDQNSATQIAKVLESLRGSIRYETTQRKLMTYQMTQYIDFEKCYRKLLAFYTTYYGKLFNTKNTDFIEDKEVLMKMLNQTSFHYKNWFLIKIEEIK